VVLGGQVRHGVGVCRGSVSSAAFNVAEPAAPDRGVDTGQRVEVDNSVTGRQTVVVVTGSSLRWTTSARKVARNASVRSCGVDSKAPMARAAVALVGW
jgi:hypothetical protein